MATHQGTPFHTPRLNPFAFPSDTDFRFALLIVVVIAASLIFYYAAYNEIPANGNRSQTIQAQCTHEATKAHPLNSPADTLARLTAIYARQTAIKQCTAPFNQQRALIVVGGVAVLLTIAAVIYFLFPRWKIWREKLEPLLDEEHPEMAAHLAHLCQQAELATPPQFLVRPLSRAASGLAFGHRGRYYVVLNGGLVIKFSQDPAAFRATLLHELAHLRNADVDKTYFSLAIGLAFLPAVILPWLFIGVTSALPADRFINMGWRLLVLSAFVYLTILAILRAREVYADVRASVWDGPAGSLSQLLATLPRPKGSRWLQFLHFHPDPAERRKLLQETYRLFPLGFWEAFITGLATAASLLTIDTTLSDLISVTNDSLLPVLPVLTLATGLLFSPLIIGVVGIGIWRATFATMVTGKAHGDIRRLAAGLGLGFVLGQQVSFPEYAFLQSGRAVSGSNLLIFYAIWLPLVMLGFSAFLGWITTGASTWLEVSSGNKSPRVTYRLGLSLVGLCLAVWLAILNHVYVINRIGPDPSLSVNSVAQHEGWSSLALPQLILESVSQSPFTLLVLVCLWGFPLSAWLWRKRIGLPFRSNWPLLDPSHRPLVLLPQPPLRLDLALVTGVIGGLIASALLIALTQLLGKWPIFARIVAISLLVGSVPPGDREVLWFLWLSNGQTLVAAVMQTILAAVVTCWIRRLGSLHALLSAFIAGCFLSVAALLNLFLYFYHPASNLLTIFSFLASMVWFMFASIVNKGAIFSIPLVLIMSLFVGWLHKLVKQPGT